jgi:hypothetical protein
MGASQKERKETRKAYKVCCYTEGEKDRIVSETNR